jgi:hypothetical protein
MRGGSSRSPLAIAAVLLLVAGLVTWWGMRRPAKPSPESPQATLARAIESARLKVAAGALPSPALALPPLDADDDARPTRERNPLDPLGDVDDPGAAWASVDMEAIRAALPDNTYWKMGAPTKDPEVLRWREEERARWNVEYGKVLSNTATAEEIDAYYAERQKLSNDYLEFIVHLLTNYGYQIPMRDVALMKLAAEMHLARLEEIPRQITEAQARREEHDAARRAWLEEQKAFEKDSPR